MKTRSGKRTKDRYLDLIQQFPLRPIRSDSDLDEAIAVLDQLLDQLDHKPWNQAEKDYVDILSDMIEKYESVHIPMKPVSDGDMLNFLIEAKGVTQAQVAKDCRIAESTISELLAGTRKLSRNHIGKLCRYFHVEPGVFNFDA